MTDEDDIPPPLRDDILSAFALLSRLPVTNHTARGAAAAWAWPLVGATLGVIAAIAVGAMQWLGLTPGVTAALALGLLAVVTGALHEDGLADTADGFFGGQTRERRLEIMKDSHIGSFGTLALILVTLARWSALASLCATGGATVALIATGALSRAPMVALMHALPNARDTGMSRATGRPSRQIAVLAAVIAWVIGHVLIDWTALWLAVGLAGLALVLGTVAQRKIGGQTGDVLGASQQLADLLCLAVLAAVFAGN